MNLPKSAQTTKITPRTNQRLIQEITKWPWITLKKKLKASLVLVKISVHDLTIRKRLGKKCIRVDGENQCWPKRTHLTKEPLWCSPRYLVKYSAYWREEGWTKVLGPVTSKLTTFHKKNIIPTVKGGDSLIVWGWFPVSYRKHVFAVLVQSVISFTWQLLFHLSSGRFE